MSKKALSLYNKASKTFDLVDFLHAQGELFEPLTDYEDFDAVAEVADTNLEANTWIKARAFYEQFEANGQDALIQMASDRGVSVNTATMYSDTVDTFMKLTPTPVLSYSHHAELAIYYIRNKLSSDQVDKLITKAETEGRVPVKIFKEWIRDEARVLIPNDGTDETSKEKVNHAFQFRVRGPDESFEDYQAQITQAFKDWFKDFLALEKAKAANTIDA